MNLSGFVGHGPPFGGFGFVHLIGPVLAGPYPVGGNDRGFEFVGLFEFHLFCLGGAGHAGQAGVEQEEVLVSDRGEGLGLGLDRQGFLGLDGLVLSVTPAAPRHHPSGELIDDHRFAVAHDVVHILHEQLLRFEGVGDVMGQGLGVEQIRYPEHLFGLGEAFIGEGAAALLLIHLVVALGIDAVFAQLRRADQGIGYLGRLLVFLLGPFHLTGNDQGCGPRRSGSNPPHQSRRTGTPAAPPPRCRRPCCRAGSRNPAPSWWRR